MLRALGHRVLAVSGQLCRSPLAMREAALAIDVPVRHPVDLQQGILFDPDVRTAPAMPARKPAPVGPAPRLMRFGAERLMGSDYDQTDRVRGAQGFAYPCAEDRGADLLHGAHPVVYPRLEDDEGEVDELGGAPNLGGA